MLGVFLHTAKESSPIGELSWQDPVNQQGQLSLKRLQPEGFNFFKMVSLYIVNVIPGENKASPEGLELDEEKLFWSIGYGLYLFGEFLLEGLHGFGPEFRLVENGHNIALETQAFWSEWVIINALLIE